MPSDLEIAYHLKELEIARNPGADSHAMPEFLATDQVILDIGCGIGQTLAAATQIHGRFLVGIDTSLDCIAYGHRHFDYIAYVNCGAERLPFQSGSFDLAIARVSLPYTNIQSSVSEIFRVLRTNGRVWVTLHPFSMTMKRLLHSIRSRNAKDVIYQAYVLVNGVMFHFSGKQFPLISHRKYESFQTAGGMFRAMKRAGFKDIFVGQQGKQLVCTGRRLA